MKKYCSLFLLLAFCNSCVQEKKIPINHFETIYEIVEYDSIYSDKNDKIIGLGAYTDIEMLNNIIISKNRNENDYFFSFYDIDKGVLLNSWGRKGQGPNEYVQLGSSFTVFDSQLVFLDRAKKEINYIAISSILNKENSLNITKEPYPYTEEFRPTHLNIISDKKIAIGSFKTGRFGILDLENKIIDSPSDYPFNFKEISGIYKGSVFQCKIKSNIEQSKFVIVTLASDVFEIYQVTNSGIYKTYLSPYNHAPIIIKKPGEYLDYTIDYDKSIGGLTNMSVSKDLICFTYSSKNYNEYADSNYLSNELLCFNWNGEKVKKYILPFPINNFCLDDNYIYGICEYDEESVIYRFKM